MLQNTLILALAGVASATAPFAFTRHHAGPSRLLASTSNNPRLMFGAQDTCYSFQEECDSFWCIPIGGECCGDGNGAYCEIGTYCQTDGCCPIGQTCSGPPTGCTSDDKELCDGYCIPVGSECCGDGYYCDAGETCTSDGFCESGSSDDDESASCDSDQAVCDGYCIPDDAVCCGDGYYCDAGETCTDDGYCDPPIGDDDDDEDEEVSPTDDDDTASETYTLEPLPTETTTEEETSTTEEETTTTTEEETSTTEEPTTTTEEETTTTEESSAENTDDVIGGGSGDGDTGAGSMLVPSFLMGLIALIPLAL